ARPPVAQLPHAPSAGPLLREALRGIDRFRMVHASHSLQLPPRPQTVRRASLVLLPSFRGASSTMRAVRELPGPRNAPAPIDRAIPAPPPPAPGAAAPAVRSSPQTVDRPVLTPAPPSVPATPPPRLPPPRYLPSPAAIPARRNVLVAQRTRPADARP